MKQSQRSRRGIPAAAVALILVLAFSMAPMVAAVPESSPAGFMVIHERAIPASPETVFAALARVGDWWHPDHTYTGSAGNLSLDLRGDGCFCEKLPDRGRVRHMTVVYAEPGVRLRMSGGLGPLQSLAVAGSMTWDLEAAEGATRLRLTYKVAGWDPDGLESWAGPVDQVLGMQVDRLKQLIETGDPER